MISLMAIKIGGVRFASSTGLLFLLGVPLVIAGYVILQRRRQAAAVKFTNLGVLSSVVKHEPSWKRHLPAFIFILALLTLCLGTGQPRAKINVSREEATVILIVDVSGSMTADDVLPSRIEAAKAAAGTFLDQVPEKFRVGVISFSTTPQTLTLPTTDRQADREALASMEAEGGTAMGDAIERALDIKRGPKQTTKPQVANGTTSTVPDVPSTTVPSKADDIPFVVLLLSDGKNTLGETDPLDAADEAKALNVPIFTIALGTANGRIANPDPSTQSISPYIEVPPDPATLRNIAKTTGGEFFDAPDAAKLDSVYKSLGSKVGQVKQESDITHWFAIGAAMLFLVAAGLSLAWQERIP